MEGPGGLARMLTWIQGSGLDPMIRSGSEDLPNPAPYFSRFCWFLSLSGTAGFGGGGGAGPGVWRKCEALLVPVPSSQEPLVGEQVLWFDPDIKLPPGVVEELTWWVGAGGSLWGGAACYVLMSYLPPGVVDWPMFWEEGANIFGSFSAGAAVCMCPPVWGREGPILSSLCSSRRAWESLRTCTRCKSLVLIYQ